VHVYGRSVVQEVFCLLRNANCHCRIPELVSTLWQFVSLESIRPIIQMLSSFLNLLYVPSGPSLWCLSSKILYAIFLSSCVLEFSKNAAQFHLFLVIIFHYVHFHKCSDIKTLNTDIFSCRICCSLTLAWRPNSTGYDAMSQVNTKSQDVMPQKAWSFMRYIVMKYWNTNI
jgi:hypothetical protein